MRPLFLCLLLTFALPLQAQTVEAQLQAMQAELRSLRAEVESLKRELRNEQGESVIATLPLMQAQIEEHAQTKVESSSRFPVKLFGTLASNTFWNSGNPDWIDIPNVVRAPDYSRGSFSSTMRQTRLGASFIGPDVGPFQTSGVIAMDFFGGIPNFATGQAMGTPRLLYGYMRLDGKRTSFEIGQDYMILAPKNPTSLSGMAFPLLYRSGNLYLRAPQLRIEQTLTAGPKGDLRLTVGILAAIAGDFPPLSQFFLRAGAGEKSRVPGVQTRLAWSGSRAGPYEKPSWELGAAGHYSKEKYATGIVSSWVGAVDLDVNRGPIGIGGEYFWGQNLDAFGGSVAPENTSVRQHVQSRGGWIETRFALASQLSLNTGYGKNRLHQRPTGNPDFRSNAGAFGNLIYQFTPEFAAGLEYRRQMTRPQRARQEMNHNVNLTFVYSF